MDQLPISSPLPKTQYQLNHQQPLMPLKPNSSECVGNGKSLFFTLPPELRNQVYRDVFTMGKEIFCASYTMISGVIVPTTYLENAKRGHLRLIEVNNLRFVCRQFLKEASGLELQFNKVVFCKPSSHLPGPVSTFERCLQFCLPANKEETQTVTLYRVSLDHSVISGEATSMSLRQINDICVQNPNLKIKLVTG